MSAFLLSKKHIDVLVSIRDDHHHSGALAHLTLDELGRKLWRENMLSLHARYGDAIDEAALRSYRYSEPAPRRTAVELIKAIHCYEYQTCEHEEWNGCEARKWCAEMVDMLTSELPGYADAAWAIG